MALSSDRVTSKATLGCPSAPKLLEEASAAHCERLDSCDRGAEPPLRPQASAHALARVPRRQRRQRVRNLLDTVRPQAWKPYQLPGASEWAPDSVAMRSLLKGLSSASADAEASVKSPLKAALRAFFCCAQTRINPSLNSLAALVVRNLLLLLLLLHSHRSCHTRGCHPRSLGCRSVPLALVEASWGELLPGRPKQETFI